MPIEATGDSTICPLDRCDYLEDLGQCWTKGRPVPCSFLSVEPCDESELCQWLLLSVEPCDESELCQWQPSPSGAGACIPCSGSECAITPPPTTAPPPAPPCSSYSGSAVYDCPEPSCQLKEKTIGCGAPVCVPADCTDATYSPNSCSFVGADCVYDPDSEVCYNKTQPFPCSQITYEQYCSSSLGCTWQPKNDEYNLGGFCFSTATGPGCDAYDSNAAACRELGTSCDWDLDIWACVNASRVIPCSEFTENGDCPADRCHVVQGLCWDAGSVPPCNAFCEAYACIASGACTFDQSNFECKPCDAGGCPTLQSCDTYTKETECPEAACVWIFSEDYNDDINSEASGTCTKKTCPDIFEESECLSFPDFPCDWDATTYRCSTKGVPLPCEEYYDSNSCPTGCTFNTDVGFCLPTGQPLPCNVSSDFIVVLVCSQAILFSSTSSTF